MNPRRNSAPSFVLFALAFVACSEGPKKDVSSKPEILAEFTGHVDVASGTMAFDSIRSREVVGTSVRGLTEIPVLQDGVPGSGPDNTVELVTEATGDNLDVLCGRENSFCGRVTLRSFYSGLEVRAAHVVITRITPSTGHVAFGDSPSQNGLSSTYGLWTFGNLGVFALPYPGVGNSGTRTWKFERWSEDRFTFTGLVMGRFALPPGLGGPPYEVCTGGVDENADGEIDCRDPECAADPSCVTREVCGNGHDDDADGDEDCDDPDCVADPACPGGPSCADGMRNQGETGVDCGGSICPPCIPSGPPAVWDSSNWDEASWQ